MIISVKGDVITITITIPRWITRRKGKSGKQYKSPKYQMILVFIKEFIKENKCSPSIREIAKGCSITSTSVVHYYLEGLEDMNKISRVPTMHRSIRVL